MGIEVAWDHAQTFISATFSGAERHVRRLEKVARLEEPSSRSGELIGSSRFREDHRYKTMRRQRAKSTAGTERIGHGGATHQTANLCSKLNCASLPRPQGRAGAPVPATGSGEPLGTDAEPGPSLSNGVPGPSHPPGGCSVTRPPSCCVTRPRAWSRTSILNRFASLLAGADAER